MTIAVCCVFLAKYKDITDSNNPLFSTKGEEVTDSYGSLVSAKAKESYDCQGPLVSAKAREMLTVTIQCICSAWLVIWQACPTARKKGVIEITGIRVQFLFGSTHWGGMCGWARDRAVTDTDKCRVSLVARDRAVTDTDKCRVSLVARDRAVTDTDKCRVSLVARDLYSSYWHWQMQGVSCSQR